MSSIPGRRPGYELGRVLFTAVDDDLEVVQLDVAVPTRHVDHVAVVHRLLGYKLQLDAGIRLVLEAELLVVDVVADRRNCVAGDGKLRSDHHLPIQASRARGK